MTTLGVYSARADGATSTAIGLAAVLAARARTLLIDLNLDNPEVATVTVQGQTVYQVGGGTMREEGIGGGSDEDVKLVSSQAGVSADEAATALRQSNGDLAQAIILLKQKRSP